ncbi:MAG TPA: hypothetical protein PLB05_04495 [Candidatus Omnitrophota bacterium]|jgi:hypothetical protein|nr:hypothetical protein [Candidatus Omnitrophota bacterium]HPN56967.1 hypothetical protein [Candidatus Omnitrophota bacterium]
MKRFAIQCVLYLATVIIMGMTLIAIVAWHLYKWGYRWGRRFKTPQNAVDVCCRKPAPPAEPAHNVPSREELEPPMVSVSEKV